MEEQDMDHDLIAHLGPLAALAGAWEGQGLVLQSFSEVTVS